MITLAFDSTAKAASVAVVKDGRVLADFTVDNGLTQSELLLPMAESVLHALKLSFSDVNLLAATVGPGSFTGVRIGVALVKGIAFGKSTPCVAVSTIEALAENLSPIDAVIVPVMDAKRSQVYTAIFDSDGKEIKRLTEDMAIGIDELAKRLDVVARGRKIYLSGDGYEIAKKMLTELGVKVEETPALLINENAASVAKVAIRSYERGKYVTDSEFIPTYLRVPQAERERLEREAGKSAQ